MTSLSWFISKYPGPSLYTIQLMGSETQENIFKKKENVFQTGGVTLIVYPIHTHFDTSKTASFQT